MEGQTAFQLWTAVFAVLTSVFSSVFLAFSPGWSVWAKRAVVGVVAVVLATAGLWYEGKLDLANLSVTWMVVFLAATGVYHLLVKGLGAALTPGDEYEPLP